MRKTCIIKDKYEKKTYIYIYIMFGKYFGEGSQETNGGLRRAWLRHFFLWIDGYRIETHLLWIEHDNVACDTFWWDVHCVSICFIQSSLKGLSFEMCSFGVLSCLIFAAHNSCQTMLVLAAIN